MRLMGQWGDRGAGEAKGADPGGTGRGRRLFMVGALLTMLLFQLLSTGDAITPTASAVTLTSVQGYKSIQDAAAAHHSLYIPPGEYVLDRPLVFDNWKDGVVVGAGRHRTIIVVRGGNQIRFNNCRSLTFCNLNIRSEKLDAGRGATEVTGAAPGNIRMLNVLTEGGSSAGTGTTAGLVVRAPSNILVQGCHFTGCEQGLVIDHPGANVVALGGNYQSEIVHLRQMAGQLAAYTIGFQGATGGCDVELDSPSPRPVVIAGCRTEGPGHLLRTAVSADRIDAVVKGCSVSTQTGFIRYGAAGTLWLIGNNAPTGIDASGSAGTVYSFGNQLGSAFKAGSPYVVGDRGQVLSAADLWGTVKPGEPYKEPGNALIDGEGLRQAGKALPTGTRFLGAQDTVRLPPPAAPVIPAPMPEIANAADLLPVARQYGAVGDGKTDDTAALQKALDANRGGELFIPPGVYIIRKPLFLDHWAGGWLVGGGMDRTRIVNTAGGGVIRTDGCGYAAFQDLSFETTPRGSEPTFDLSWDQRHPAKPDFGGAALQANVFYRCRFSGGSQGLYIGREGYMGSESLICQCRFEHSKMGLAVGNFNALTDNAVNCLFSDNDVAAGQAGAGSFNILNSTFERSTSSDLQLGSSAGDSFYIENTTSASPRLLQTNNTGAAINIVFDGFRFVGPPGDSILSYSAGGSVVFLNGELGGGMLSAGGSIANKTVVLLNTQATAKEPIHATDRARSFILQSPEAH